MSKPTIDADIYQIIVRFDRSLGDDTDILKSPGSKPTPSELAWQLARELQVACDSCGLAGAFQIESVTIEGVGTTISA